MQKFLKLSDLYASTWLDLNGVSPTLEPRGTRTLFVFPASDHVYQLLNEFNSGAECSAIDYSTRLRELRSRMHGAKEGPSST